MKKLLRGFIVAITIAVATFAASASAHACGIWFLYEPKIPSSLIIRD